MSTPGAPVGPLEVLPTLRPLASDEILARRELVAVAPTLDDADTAHTIRFGEVVFGRVDLSLLELDDFPPFFRRRTRTAVSRYVLLTISFDLPRLPAGHRYERVSVSCALAGADAATVQVRPGRRLVEVQMSREPDLVPHPEQEGVPEPEQAAPGDWDTAFAALVARIDKRAYPTADDGVPQPSRESRPVVTTFGPGRPRFGWLLESQLGHPLWHQSFVGAGVVELPRGAGEVSGVLTAEVVLLRPRQGGMRPVQVRPTAPTPFQEPLPPVQA